MKVKSSLILLFSLFLIFAGCKKYVVGPKLSSMFIKQRIVNKWKYEEYMQQTICGWGYCPPGLTDFTQYRQEYYIEFSDDMTFLDHRETHAYEGEWKIVDNNEWIDMCYKGNCGTYKWKIIRLKEKELWIEEYMDDILWSTRKLKPL